MSLLYQHYARQKAASSSEGTDLSALTPTHHPGHLKPSPAKRQMAPKPVNWREVALRRRRVADCQLIGCVVTSGLLILISGLAMFLVAWYLLGKEDPFILIGPVFAGCGIVVLLLSVEICVRRQKVIKQTEDLSSDDDDDHLIDEGLINYGYGHFKGDDIAPVPSKSPARKEPLLVRSQSQDPDDYQPSFEKVDWDPRTVHK